SGRARGHGRPAGAEGCAEARGPGRGPRADRSGVVAAQRGRELREDAAVQLLRGGGERALGALGQLSGAVTTARYRTGSGSRRRTAGCARSPVAGGGATPRTPAAGSPRRPR